MLLRPALSVARTVIVTRAFRPGFQSRRNRFSAEAWSRRTSVLEPAAASFALAEVRMKTWWVPRIVSLALAASVHGLSAFAMMVIPCWTSSGCESAPSSVSWGAAASVPAAT